jgi:hypothetical protein
LRFSGFYMVRGIWKAFCRTWMKKFKGLIGVEGQRIDRE